MSNFAITSNDTTAACPSRLQPHIPDAWRSNSGGANFTQMACTAPTCNNFPSILSKCCGRPESEFQTFNTSSGPYVSCELSVNDTAAYQAYQQCLVVNFVTPFRCNGPDNFPTIEFCGAGIETPPVVGMDGQQACGLPTGINTTKALLSCCSNATDTGAGLTIYGDGCYTACVSNATDSSFSKCIQQTGLNIGAGYVCDSMNGSINLSHGNHTSGQNQTGEAVRKMPSVAGMLVLGLVVGGMVVS